MARTLLIAIPISILAAALLVLAWLFSDGATDSVDAVLVQIIDTSLFETPSPDPSGIAYLPFSDSFLVSDSEVNEIAAIFTGNNVFELDRSGNLLANTTTTAFSNEPTGIAFDLISGHLFISDDDQDEIFELNPGKDGELFTVDDEVTSFDTTAFSSFDPEGVAFDSSLRALYIADGEDSKLYRVTSGENGNFDGVSPMGDDHVNIIDTKIIGIADPEGVEYDAATGELYVIGRNGRLVAHISTTGTLIRVVNLPVTIRKPSGLGLAPSGFVPGAMSLFVTDRGVDNNQDADENDGKVYEFFVPAVAADNDR